MKLANSQRGFTLIEMTVSLGLFTIIMFIATSAFLSIVNTDRKARSVGQEVRHYCLLTTVLPELIVFYFLLTKMAIEQNMKNLELVLGVMEPQLHLQKLLSQV